MRWLFMLLVVLNLFYYVWHLQGVASEPRPAEYSALKAAEKHNIQLLSEASERLAPAVAGASSAEPETCLFIGGAAQRDLADQLRQRVLSLGAQGDIREESVASDTDFWLYLPPLASREASLRQLRELQARQIEGYLIGEGDLANGISLGMFARESVAQAARDKIRAAGYEPALRELPRARTSYWVRIRPDERRLIGPQVLEQLSKDFSGLQHRLEACESLASP
jgi:hypothetical protein